ncbi:hypothetical protein PR003_g8915 [Phytophthora rubi]|nr:hypothetical protein PR002_g8045 [Phytophthora rubi]KAE9343565.1 hypothetical protein PR003_g8915 [Phytophthora rubi]
MWTEYQTFVRVGNEEPFVSDLEEDYFESDNSSESE